MQRDSRRFIADTRAPHNMFDFLRKKDSSPASSAQSPDDPTSKWRTQIQALESSHTALKALLARRSCAGEKNGGASSNTSGVNSPSKQLDVSPEKQTDDTPNENDVSLPASASSPTAASNFVESLLSLCDKDLSPQLEISVARLRQQCEHIAKAFNLCRDLKAECAGLHKKNEALTVESEAARLTVIELMKKISVISPKSAVAAQQQQVNLKAQLEVTIREQRHRAELQRLKMDNAKLVTSLSIPSHNNSFSSSGNVHNDSFSLSSSSLPQPSSSAAEDIAPTSPVAQTVSDARNRQTSGDEPQQQAQQQRQVEQRQAADDDERDMQHALAIAQHESARRLLSEQVQSLQQALEQQKLFAEKSSAALQEHISDLRGEVAELKQQLSAAKTAAEKSAQDFGSQLAASEREKMFAGKLLAAQSEELRERHGRIAQEEAVERQNIQIIFIGNVLASNSLLQARVTQLANDLADNTRVLMQIQKDSGSPQEKPKSRQSFF